MKLLFPLALFTIVAFLTNCNKSDDNPTHINCDGLITDTSGTNDNAKIYMPNAFTPNSDGLNDIIRPYTQNITSINFTIYDENNNIVYSTAQLGQGWTTTTPANSATKYYYKIQAVTASNHKIGMCGDLYKLTCKPANAPTLLFEDQITSNGFTGPTLETLPTCL